MPRPTVTERRLLATTGPLRGASFPLLDGLTIGRGPNVDVMLIGPGVARRHCQVRQRNDGTHVIVDLGSSTGTWASGERVDELVLREGTAFEIAGSRFVCGVNEASRGEYCLHRSDAPIDRTTIRTGGHLVLGPIPRAVYPGELVADLVMLREAWLCTTRGGKSGLDPRVLSKLIGRLSIGYDGARPRFVQFTVDIRATATWSGCAAATMVTVERLGVDGAAIRCDPDLLAPGQWVWLELEPDRASRVRARLVGRVSALTERGVAVAFVGFEPDDDGRCASHSCTRLLAAIA